MEHVDVSDDDDDFEEEFEEGSQMEVSEIGRENLSSINSNDSASENLVNAVLPVPEADYVAMETFSESKECVLCKRKVCGVYIVRLLSSYIKIIEGCF